MTGNCQACGVYGVMDVAHIKSKGSGGGNEEWNLILLCRTHHRLQHSIGWARFVENHQNVMKILESKGWEIVDEFGVKKLKRIYVEE